jgi:2'-5' RNA ligase
MRERIAQVERSAGPALSGEPIHWTRPETIHLTLRFLGETTAARLDSVRQGAEARARSWASFDLHVAGLGCFPDIRRPRIIWVGASDESGSLEAIVRDLEQLARAAGFSPEERAFSAHLTIGRVRERLSPDGARRFASYLGGSSMMDFGSIHVESVDLMRSELKPAGPVYSMIAELALGAVRMGSS